MEKRLIIDIERIVDKYLPKKYNFNTYINPIEREKLFNDILSLINNYPMNDLQLIQNLRLALFLIRKGIFKSLEDIIKHEQNISLEKSHSGHNMTEGFYTVYVLRIDTTKHIIAEREVVINDHNGRPRKVKEYYLGEPMEDPDCEK